jgi:hypothetical protein
LSIAARVGFSQGQGLNTGCGEVDLAVFGICGGVWSAGHPVQISRHGFDGEIPVMSGFAFVDSCNVLEQLALPLG